MSCLKAFLYETLKNFPAGKVEKLVRDSEKTLGKRVQYCNPHLEAYAEELVGRLMSEERVPYSLGSGGDAPSPYSNHYHGDSTAEKALHRDMAVSQYSSLGRVPGQITPPAPEGSFKVLEKPESGVL